jgi:hypothetical protein
MIKNILGPAVREGLLFPPILIIQIEVYIAGSMAHNEDSGE